MLGTALLGCLAWTGLAVSERALAQDATPATEGAGGSSDDNVVNYINQYIRQGWTDNELKPSAPAPDGEWMRRFFLDTVGRIPMVAEVNAYEADKSENRKALLVNKVLFSEQYEEELARNWTTVWTNLLIGRNGGNDRDRPVNRLGLMQYLRRNFLKNKPYDQMVYELVSARGNNTPGEENYNGAVNFLLDNLQEEQVPATNKVSQLLLGMRVGCTQCHNHPFNDWKQDAFWGMNAFFKQAKSLRTTEGRKIISARLEDQDFPGQGNNPEEAEIYYELRNGVLRVAYPVFVDGTKIGTSGYVEDVNRRTELAKLIKKSPATREAIVNRMWGHFLGYGFTKPVDDMGPHNPPSHPELLEKLATDFGAYGHDLRRLMKWIVLSEAYSLSSKISSGNAKDDPLKGETPMFSHFYLRQMQAEQLYESLMAATQAAQTGKSYEEQEQLKNRWLQQFVLNFGTDENDEATTFDGTIPQALMMMNGDIMKTACECKPGSFLHGVATGGLRPAEKVSALYMATLARRPTSNELAGANQLLALRGGDVTGAMQDIWWALLNSNEFIINH